MDFKIQEFTKFNMNKFKIKLLNSVFRMEKYKIQVYLLLIIYIKKLLNKIQRL